MRPVIGITCNFDERDEVGLVTRLGAPCQKWHFVADHYIRSVEQAGGIPMLLPIYNDMETMREAADRLDGLLISGGNDINPAEYGAAVKAYCGAVLPKRDRQDIFLARAVFRETQKPILGICRGIQVLNVACGGDLYQDLEIEGNYRHHFCDMFPSNCEVHKVKLAAGSRIGGILGKETVSVNSFHHQAVKQAAPGFLAGACSEDGVVESIEFPGERFALGIQWHPEMMYDSEEQQKIFRAFIDAC
ncbi:gamma-glutamyl-gamma-aminobutyrate hydrolase family protein [Clostridium transplantifaecale]|uniref:gamma-glutamyl-gamma-aminobutyrate hydrolase family protein n=1 Tax=Clostridium transplantifaecale TaxID=2479838 RepID=UPI000F632312|nr:gamma-glutamyl-gamma-aminobutyrate hydrolase family protein [Clostridium transplantifaecale]